MKIRLAGHNDRDGRAYGYSGRKGRLPLPFGALAYSDGFRVLAQADLPLVRQRFLPFLDHQYGFT